jgi:outer membrane protein OmpA-like peptidoglycan-associated protein
MRSAGAPLDGDLRTEMERHFGADLSHVRVHTGPTAEAIARSIDARAFTHGPDIVFGSQYRPGANSVTAHELAHVVQQTAPAGIPNRLALSSRSEPGLLQRDKGGSFVLPTGGLDVDLRAVDAATHSGMDATIGFTPVRGAPNSNVIAFTQIARILNLAGGDIDPITMPGDRAPRGPLNSPVASNVPGVRTQDDPLRGVEGGYSVDVVHHNPNTGATVPQGGALAPRYPTGPGRTTVVPGFKRSDDPADIRSTTMLDAPGMQGVASANADFSFESVVLGEDTGITYGSVGWGFGLRAGHVVAERLDPPTAGASATFEEALERHRDFYVHEPVTFYFAFDSSVLDPSEAAKIGEFTAYLTRNPDIQMDVEGFADIAGGNSAYNRDLSLRRAEAVKATMIARGIPEEAIGVPVVSSAHVGPVAIGRGASTEATRNAGTGDQGGDPAVGADQSREANRWANRRVVLTFRRTTPANP